MQAISKCISTIHSRRSSGTCATVRELRGDRHNSVGKLFRPAAQLQGMAGCCTHGVSPAVGNSLSKVTRGLVPLDAETLHGLATSLRRRCGLSQSQPAGHQRIGQQPADYLRDLRRHQTPHPPYQQMEAQAPIAGCSSIPTLQIENEYYSYIRPAWRNPVKAPARRCATAASNTWNARWIAACLRSGGRQPDQAAVPRGLRRVLPGATVHHDAMNRTH